MFSSFKFICTAKIQMRLKLFPSKTYANDKNFVHEFFSFAWHTHTCTMNKTVIFIFLKSQALTQKKNNIQTKFFLEIVISGGCYVFVLLLWTWRMFWSWNCCGVNHFSLWILSNLKNQNFSMFLTLRMLVIFICILFFLTCAMEIETKHKMYQHRFGAHVKRQNV